MRLMELQIPARLHAGLMCAKQSFVFWSKPIKPFIDYNSHYIKRGGESFRLKSVYIKLSITLEEHFRCLTPNSDCLLSTMFQLCS